MRLKGNASVAILGFLHLLRATENRDNSLRKDSVPVRRQAIPVRRQAITQTNADVLPIAPLGTSFIEIQIMMQKFGYRKVD